MKTYRKEIVEEEVIDDITCSSCKKSCKKLDTIGTEFTEYEYASLNFSWGYFSNKDGLRGTFEFCEECFDKILTALNITNFEDLE